MKDRQPVPWRVFGFIGLLIVVTAFSALNLDHRSDVSLGVHTFAAVPVFLTGLVAFTLGAVLVVALTMPRRPVARRDLRSAPQLAAAPAAESARHPDDGAETPEPAAETEAEDTGEDLEQPAGRKTGWWRVKRRKETQD